jgi:prepilin peptidase CpaA
LLLVTDDIFTSLRTIDFGTGLCENPRQKRVPLGFRGVPESAFLAHYGEKTALSVQIGVGLKAAVLGLAVALALIAGWTDLRSRRIPNWLTVPGFVVGIAVNVMANGWAGLKTSLLGAGLGLLVLLPFVFLRSLGAGDWKLAGALGAFVGWEGMVSLLMGSVFVAGIMALALVIYKGRFKETLRNIGRLLASMLTLRMPGAEVSLDNPQSLKVPYGVALALTTFLFGVGKIWEAKIWGAR